MLGSLKRFYHTVDLCEESGGYSLHLDGILLKTPLKNPLRIPNHALALQVAEEWSTQGDMIQPEKMIHTKLLMTALDRVPCARLEFQADLETFSQTDLLYYRAEHPKELATAQASLWDPVMMWAQERFDVRFFSTQGVMPIAQSPHVSVVFSNLFQNLAPFPLVALHALTTLSGSLILALAVSEGFFSAQDAWSAATLDERWQRTHWGLDAEALNRETEQAEIFKKTALSLALWKQGS